MDSWVANLCGTKQLGGIVPSVRRRGRERERERELEEESPLIRAA